VCDQVVDLCMRCLKPSPTKRPRMEQAMIILTKLSQTHPCPDLMGLQASIIAIAALEDELEEYAQCLREHQAKANGLEGNTLQLSSESDLRFSRSFVGNTQHVMNEVLPKLHAEVDKVAGGKTKAAGKATHKQGMAKDSKSSTCAVQ
jgi:hypothetical protein